MIIKEDLFLISVPTSDFFDYHQQWEKLIAENKDFEFHLVCYEDLKKVRASALIRTAINIPSSLRNS